MRKLFLLAGVQLRALLLAFRIGGSRRRAVSVWAILALPAALCVYISGVYSFTLGSRLAAAGALDLLLVLMPAMAVLAGVTFTAFAAQGVVFGGRDGDFLLSMPVPAAVVLGSKLAALYLENLVFCLFLILPAGAAWLRYGGGGGPWFVLRLLAGVLFLTLLPTVLSLLAGGALSWLGGRFANRRAVNLTLYALLLAGVFALVFRVNRGVSALAAGELGAPSPGASAGWALPFLWFRRGVCGDWGTLGLFCLAMLLPALAAWALTARFYQRILTGLGSHGRRGAYALGRQRAAGPFRALVKKEASRYFGTPIYLFNTGLGLLLLTAAGGAAAVMGERFRGMLAQAGLGELPLLSLSLAAVGFLLSTVAVTASSVSLEGGNLWILREAPVSAGTILGAKAGFQMLLVCPCLLAGASGMAWGLGLTLAEWAVLLAAGLSFAGFTALLGLAVNLCLPRLDAVNDMAVVKQSAASMAATFGGMAAALACGVLVWRLTPLAGELPAALACAGVLLAACAVLTLWLRGRGAARFRALP